MTSSLLREVLLDQETNAKTIDNVLKNTTSHMRLDELAELLPLLTPSRRAELFAAVWMRRRDLLGALLESHPVLKEPSVLNRASNLLDCHRRARAAERRRASLAAGGAKASKLQAAQQALNALRADASTVPEHYSATRSFHALIRKLLASVPPERLEFDLLLFGTTGPFNGLIDHAHVNPAKVWQLDYFQPVLYGASAPSGSLLAEASAMTVQSLPELLDAHPRLASAYSFIRSKLPAHTLDSAAKLALARKIPLADALWFYEEINCAQAAAAIEQRLAAGEDLSGKASANHFGKLVERLLLFRRLGVAFWPHLLPHAERLLEGLKAKRKAQGEDGRVSSLQQLAAEAAEAAGTLKHAPEPVAQSACGAVPKLRVAVLGDASSSMQVAVEAVRRARDICAAAIPVRAPRCVVVCRGGRWPMALWCSLASAATRASASASAISSSESSARGCAIQADESALPPLML